MYINNISSIKHIHIVNLNGHLLNLLKKKLEKDEIYHFSLHVNHSYKLYLNLTAL